MYKKIILILVIFLGASQEVSSIPSPITYAPYLSLNAMAQGMLNELHAFDVNNMVHNRLKFLGSYPVPSIIILSVGLVNDLMRIKKIFAKKKVTTSYKVGLLLRTIALKYVLPLFFVTHVYQALHGALLQEAWSEGSVKMVWKYRRFFTLDNAKSTYFALYIAAVLIAFQTQRTLSGAFSVIRWSIVKSFGGLKAMQQVIFSALGISKPHLRKRPE